MRFWLASLCLLLTSCASPPPHVPQARPDPTKEPAYTQAVQQLSALNRQAEGLLKAGRSQEAAAAITEGQPLQGRLLAAPRPPLAAMQAASDLDDLYARMLLLNHHDGWARMTYQKDAARWRSWRPRNDDSARYLRRAEEGMAECDRRLKE
ncbi:MAG: hypothetical protein LAQ30_03770 [Acidobacteriia bacterium]|nr:hypothetical protein [Terriglobia bacterium]